MASVQNSEKFVRIGYENNPKSRYKIDEILDTKIIRKEVRNVKDWEKKLEEERERAKDLKTVFQGFIDNSIELTHCIFGGENSPPPHLCPALFAPWELQSNLMSAEDEVIDEGSDSEGEED